MATITNASVKSESPVKIPEGMTLAKEPERISCCELPQCGYSLVNNTIVLPLSLAKFLYNNGILLVNKNVRKDVLPSVNKYLGVVIGAAIIFIIVIVLLYVFLGRTNSVNAQTALVGTVIVSIVVLVMFTIVAVGTIIVMKGSVKEIYKSITLIPEPNSK